MHEGHRARLRETYWKQGAAALHEHQLLELLLTFSIPRADTNAIAHALLQRFNSLEAIFNSNQYELMQVEGVGEKSAILLTLIGEFMKKKNDKSPKVVRLNTPAAAVEYCKTLFLRERYEAMYMIALDKNMKVLNCEKVSSGTLTETAVYPRIIVECALRHSANSILLTHNHPSGDASSSVQDVDTTLLILKALEPIGIKLNDHIIIGAEHTYSMTRNALIEDTLQMALLAAVAEKEGGL